MEENILRENIDNYIKEFAEKENDMLKYGGNELAENQSRAVEVINSYFEEGLRLGFFCGVIAERSLEIYKKDIFSGLDKSRSTRITISYGGSASSLAEAIEIVRKEQEVALGCNLAYLKRWEMYKNLFDEVDAGAVPLQRGIDIII